MGVGRAGHAAGVGHAGFVHRAGFSGLGGCGPLGFTRDLAQQDSLCRGDRYIRLSLFACRLADLGSRAGDDGVEGSVAVTRRGGIGDDRLLGWLSHVRLSGE
jgi:hypothetical protein